MPDNYRFIEDTRVWGILVLVTVTLACICFRISSRRYNWSAGKRQGLAAIGGALMGCSVWSLHHLAGLTPAGSFTAQHPSTVLMASLIVAMAGCALAVGNVSAALDSQARSKVFQGIDSLTGLKTRSQLEQSLRTAMEVSNLNGEKFAIILVDLDRFKGINDTLGHEAGDQVLQQIAERLRQVTRAHDRIARVGSDEFMVLLQGTEHPSGTQTVCRKILHAIAQPVQVQEQSIHITSSIGVAVYPDDGADVPTLLRKVDTALERAKSDGRGDFRIFDPEVDKALLERLAIENDLRQALSRNEFMLAYQPEFDLRSGKVVSMEALLRWRKQSGEFVSPATFIPIAEETGVIVPLSQWVLETACRELKELSATIQTGSRFAINLSPRQFKQDDLVEMITATLKQHAVGPESLELEITEGVLMDDPEKSAECLRTLRDLGITTAIDDFGTGYSSLSYLRRFPIDKLKMDRAFVSDIHNDKDGAALTESILRMAHQLGLTVVAEGVELTQQLDFLRSVHCDTVQGYLLARPMFLADLKVFLAKHQPAEWATK